MKKETNKTVVEQLVEKIEHYSNYTIRIPIDAVEQFKEMEKEQMVDFSFKYGDLTTRQIADSFDKEYKTNEK